MSTKRNTLEIQERKKQQEAYWKKRKADILEEDQAFQKWKEENGLTLEAYSESKHGPIEHRCEDYVLRFLFKRKYKRPVLSNSKNHYFEIMMVSRDDSEWFRVAFIRCDQLSGAQFDHLCALKVGASDEGRVEKRVERWFEDFDSADQCELACKEAAEKEEDISHPMEIGLFRMECSDCQDDSPIVLITNANEFIPTIALQCNFSVAFKSVLEEI